MWRFSNGKLQQLFLIIATFSIFFFIQEVSCQTFGSTSTEKEKLLSDDFSHSINIMPTTETQQSRKGLNELPEMKKAKELKDENEKVDLEASRLHELAQIEEELRQKETTEMMELTTILPTHLIFNKDEKKLNGTKQEDKKMTFEESKGMHQVEPSPNAGDIEESFGFEINTTMPTTKEELNSEVPSFPPLLTTLKSTTITSKFENGGDVEGSVDDPFQTSTSTFEDGIEKETIHETMNVQSPIINNITNGKEGETNKDDLLSTDSNRNDSKEIVGHSFILENSDDKLKVEEKVNDSKEVNNEEISHSPSESTESKVEGAHPIAFIDSHTERPFSTSQMTFEFSTTTEEPEIMVGDKSVFEGGEDTELPTPKKALIHHMSSENGEEKKEEETPEEQQQNSSKHSNLSSSINIGNTKNKNQEESSDFGFVSSKEEMEESKITTKDSTNEENDGSKMSTVSVKLSEDEKKMASGIEQEGISVNNHSAMMVTPSNITPKHIGGKEVIDGLNINDSIGSTEILMTSTIDSRKDEATTEKIGDMNEKELVQGEEKEEERSDDGGGISHLLPKFPDNENIVTTTQKRGDLPGTEETTMVAVEPEVEAKPEKVEEKSFINSNETSTVQANNPVNDEEIQTTELPFTTIFTNEQLEKAKQHAFHTSFSIRFPDIEWRSEFSDLSSGTAKKLIEQIIEDLRMVLSKALGPSNTLLDVNISNLRMGSVLVEGEILTKEEVIEPQTMASALEQAILAKGGELGGNSVDTDKLQIGGHLPNAGISLNDVSPSPDGQQKREEEVNNSTNTGLIIGGAVVVGVLIIVFAVFAIVVFGLNNRRSSQGSLKLSGRECERKKREEISMVENGNGAFGQRRFVSANDVISGSDSHSQREDGVNLTSLRSTSTGSQFVSSTNGYGTNRH